MNLSKILKRSAVVLMIAFSIALIPTACTEEVVTNDSTSVSNSLTPASLAAPEITGKAFDGVNYITWKPVKNATGYRLYRDNVWIQDYSTKLDLSDPFNPIYPDDLKYYDYASLNAAIPSIQNGKSYTYTVVATGVQASRGTNTSTSNNTDFVMTDADILGDGIASVTITAKVPEVFSKVEAAKNVKAAYMNDIAYGKVMGIYFEKPEYIKSYVEFAHDETGSGINIYDYLAYGYKGEIETGTPPNTTPKLYFTQNPSQDGTYTWTPAYGGKYKFRVVTSWDNSFYQSNDVSGDIEIPSQEKAVPPLTAAAVDGGIKLTFTDTEKASYTLYRAEDTDAVAAWSFTKVADDSDFAKTECGGGDDVDYAFVDTTGLDYEHYYVYVLTATKGGKALTFDSDAPAVAFAQYNTPLSWTPQFAAINVAGTVKLSWNVEPGITYKVLKCAIDRANPVPPALVGVETAHTESYLTVDASDVAAAVNKVFVMEDSIERRKDTGYYRYTLIGTDAAGATGSANDEITGYHTTTATFDIPNTGIIGLDTDKNGIYDKVEITLNADSNIAQSAIKLYRAEIGSDDKTTSAGTNNEFITGYTLLSLTPTVTDNGDGTKTYVYVDNTLTEANIAMKAYAYAATTLYNNVTLDDVGTCTLCVGDISIPQVVMQIRETSNLGDPNNQIDNYSLGWNAEYKNFVVTNPANDEKLAPSAAVVTVMYAYSNDVIGDVKDWNKVTPSASEYNDYTYVFKTADNRELSIGKGKTEHYLHVRVLYTNAQYPEKTESAPTGRNYYENTVTNPIWVGTTETQITAINGTGGTPLYINNATPREACYILTDGTLEEIEVWVTWMTNTAIWADPVNVTVTQVPNDTGTYNYSNGYYQDTDQLSWYFLDTPPDTTKVTRALVHVKNTQGKTLRSEIVTRKWW